MSRRIWLLASLVLLAACEKQPHNDSAPPELADWVTGVVYAELQRVGQEPDELSAVTRRRLDQRIRLLTAHAQDDHLALAAIARDIWSSDVVRQQAVDTLEQLQHQRPGAKAPPILHRLLAAEPWTADQTGLVRILTRALLHEQRLEAPPQWEAPGA